MCTPVYAYAWQWFVIVKSISSSTDADTLYVKKSQSIHLDGIAIINKSSARVEENPRIDVVQFTKYSALHTHVQLKLKRKNFLHSLAYWQYIS